MTTRRAFLTGVVSLIAAPAIVRASSLMPVRAWVETWPHREVGYGFLIEGYDAFGVAISEFCLRPPSGQTNGSLNRFKRITSITSPI